LILAVPTTHWQPDFKFDLRVSGRSRDAFYFAVRRQRDGWPLGEPRPGCSERLFRHDGRRGDGNVRQFQADQILARLLGYGRCSKSHPRPGGEGPKEKRLSAHDSYVYGPFAIPPDAVVLRPERPGPTAGRAQSHRAIHGHDPD